MPNCWRTILAIKILKNIYDFQLDPCILLKWYHVKENTHESFRNILNVHHGKKIFSENFYGDKNWREFFFFTSSD